MAATSPGPPQTVAVVAIDRFDDSQWMVARAGEDRVRCGIPDAGLVAAVDGAQAVWTTEDCLADVKKLLPKISALPRLEALYNHWFRAPNAPNPCFAVWMGRTRTVCALLHNGRIAGKPHTNSVFTLRGVWEHKCREIEVVRTFAWQSPELLEEEFEKFAGAVRSGRTGVIAGSEWLMLPATVGAGLQQELKALRSIVDPKDSARSVVLGGWAAASLRIRELFGDQGLVIYPENSDRDFEHHAISGLLVCGIDEYNRKHPPEPVPSAPPFDAVKALGKVQAAYWRLLNVASAVASIAGNRPEISAAFTDPLVKLGAEYQRLLQAITSGARERAGKAEIDALFEAAGRAEIVPARILGIVDTAGRNAIASELIVDLLRALDWERIPLERGDSISDLSTVEVESGRGRGTKIQVDSVSAAGYKVKTGEVLRKPRVVIRRRFSHAFVWTCLALAVAAAAIGIYMVARSREPRLVRTWKAAGSVARLVSTPNGSTVAVITGSPSAWKLQLFQPAAPDAQLSAPVAIPSEIVSLAPDGKTVAVPSPENGVSIVSLESGQTLYSIGAEQEVHKGAVTAIAFSPDGERVLTGATDWTVRAWNVKQQTLVVTASLDAGWPVWLAAGGNITAVGLNSGGVLYGARADSLVPLTGSPGEGLTGLAVSADGNTIAASAGKKLTIWHTGRVEAAATLDASDPIVSVAVNGDGSKVAAAASSVGMGLERRPRPLYAAKSQRNMARVERCVRRSQASDFGRGTAPGTHLGAEVTKGGNMTAHGPVLVFFTICGAWPLHGQQCGNPVPIENEEIRGALDPRTNCRIRSPIPAWRGPDAYASPYVIKGKEGFAYELSVSRVGPGPEVCIAMLSGSCQTTQRLTGTGNFRVFVTSREVGAAGFKLSVHAEPHVQECPPAETIHLNTFQAGSLPHCQDGNNHLNVRAYQFTVLETERVIIQILEPDFVPHMTLTGKLVHATGAGEIRREQLPAGTYSLELRDVNGESGNFRLRLRGACKPDDLPDRLVQKVDLSPADCRVSEIDPSAPQDSSWARLYTVNLDSLSDCSIHASSSLNVKLLPPDARVKQSAIRLLPPGKNMFVVSSTAGGLYEISRSCTPKSCATKPLAVGDRQSGRIADAADCPPCGFIRTADCQGVAHAYEFHAASVPVDMQLVSAAATLQIWEASGKRIPGNRLTAPGRYTVLVNTTQPGAEYTLTQWASHWFDQ